MCVCDVCMYKYIRIQIIREIISTEIQTERKIVTQDTTFSKHVCVYVFSIM